MKIVCFQSQIDDSLFDELKLPYVYASHNMTRKINNF